ncbi:MAG: GTP-binding protein [Bacteroidales bacterium]|jgi:sulfate adenylyltransferase subunit 1|nr:GTP-binding protein [Bacteroidales bacterium]
MKTIKTNGYLDMELLRFTTAGSVDDGKSTLIGRLLYDSKSIFEDQLEAVEAASLSRGNEEINLALLTDGLRSEREQGITIDVAYRYFATPRRKFIIADTPGHIQYTRNMVTGASTADLAIVLIDARNGVLEQTVRHSFIASLLGIRHIAVCINKMDLVGYAPSVFEKTKTAYREMSTEFGPDNIYFIPISAKLGDNVVKKSPNMPWYKGTTLMELLETVPITQTKDSIGLRFPIQYVIRPISDNFHDFRGYAGRVAGGILRKGQSIVILPRGQHSTVAAITLADKEQEMACEGESVTVQLSDDIDVGRGDLIVSADHELPRFSQSISVMVCWFNENPMRTGNRYIIRHMTHETQGIVKSIDSRININTLQKETNIESLVMNDIAEVTLKTASPLVFDPYQNNRTTGCLIFIDPNTFETVGAGMIKVMENTNETINQR